MDKKIFRLVLLVSALILSGAVNNVSAQTTPAINYFLLETDGGALLHPNSQEVSITRAQCRQRDRGIDLQVLGAVHTPATAEVTIRDAETGTVFIPDNPAVGVPVDIGSIIGAYDFSLGNNEAFLICPNKIVASIVGSSGVTAESEVDVRIDNAPVDPAALLAVELEGPITAIVDNGNGTTTLTMMGIDVLVNNASFIHTPTVNLTLAQLTDPTPMPNRVSPGFVGGTAIVIGKSNPDGTGVVGEDVFVEPAENVARGIITVANCSNVECSGTNDTLEILGSRLLRINDARMLPEPPKNSYGFEIDMSQGALVGSFVAIEGYYSERDSVNAEDTVAPLIALKGNNPTRILVGANYIDAGVVAVDNVGGDVSANVVTTGLPINTSTEGTFTITYTVSDAAGNKATTNRTVQVVTTDPNTLPTPDIVPPVVTLSGESAMTISQGSAYQEPGASWSDDKDGSGTVTNILGSVDTNRPGTYTLLYTQKDQAGNLGIVTRTVNVIAPTQTPTTNLSIQNIRVTNKVKSSAKIIVNTSVDSTALVSYGTVKSRLNLSKSDQQTTNHHEIVLKKLRTNKKYYFQVTVNMPDGSQETQSGVMSFKVTKK